MTRSDDPGIVGWRIREDDEEVCEYVYQECLCQADGGFVASLCPVHGYADVKSRLDADQAALGVDPSGDAPMPFHRAIPMDDGPVRDDDTVVPGFYRHYDAIDRDSVLGTASVVLKVDEMDRRQIAWEVARECPVVGQVVFRLVDGVVIAQLTSYVAFA